MASPHPDPDPAPRLTSAEADAFIARKATRQHGLVTYRQMVAAGITRGMVHNRVRSGRLRRVHRGVYLLGGLEGPLRPTLAREMAAVLACGPGALVSHGSAAVPVHRLLDPARFDVGRPSSPVAVTVPGRNAGRRAGIRRHQVAHLDRADRTTVEGVPVTTVARTLVDLASQVRPRTLEQAFATAERRGDVDRSALAAALARKPRAPGAELLRHFLDTGAIPAFSRSKAEDLFRGLMKEAGLPTPATNIKVLGIERDAAWLDEKVVVEVDGYEHHKSRPVFGSDRRRDANLVLHGYRTIRITWEDLNARRLEVATKVARLLGTPG